MAKETNLTAQEIYEKQFHVVLQGYEASEVDSLLDKVIEDYQLYEDKMEELGLALARYEAKIKELQSQVFALEQEKSNMKEQINSDFINGNTDQVDILKRIARLEEAVFNTPSNETEE